MTWREALDAANRARQDIKASRLARYRALPRGLTQDRAAYHLGVSPSTIRRYEAELRAGTS
jgi:DNA-binding XRE family transcriptional regulator